MALNQLLVDISTKKKLQWEVAGISHMGRVKTHNEDSYYPHNSDLANSLASHLTIVADGVVGQEGGEVASHWAVESLKWLVPPFIAEIEEKTISPDLICNQLKAIIRIGNNLICSRNDQQGRESRRRMATTLVMAVRNHRQLYLAHVGDSRAYWLTSHGCIQLTVDDTVANREIIEGGSTYDPALQHNKAIALTQTVGMKPGQLLQTQRQQIDDRRGWIVVALFQWCERSPLIRKTQTRFCRQYSHWESDSTTRGGTAAPVSKSRKWPGQTFP